MELLADIGVLIFGTVILTAYVLGIKEGMDDDE
jgi:hypothetical protein